MATATTRRDRLSLAQLADGIRAGNRALLAQAITLVESTRAIDEEAAQDLLEALLPATGHSLRIGISGVPGVGKSTFIDQFGINLIARGHKVAVMAVDPTSQRSGGSILGDKTRMHRLAASPAAFVRPSPTSGSLGGVARRTRESIILLEAAGFDIVIVETVGVGQSETEVADMVDVFLVLVLAGGGDELQGIKKGIIELADMLVITKADGENLSRAKRSAADYRSALNILTPRSAAWVPPVLIASALENRGLDTVWQTIDAHRTRMSTTGEFLRRRQNQAVSWMRALLHERLLRELTRHAAAEHMIEVVEKDVRLGRVTAVRAVEQILQALHGSMDQ